MRHVLRTVPLPALLLLVAGCATPPPPAAVDLDVETPEGWSTGDAEIDPANSALHQPDAWWTTFGPTPLDDLVREALEANRELEAAVANVEAARATATVNGADRWPQLNGSARASRTKQIFVGLPIPGSGVLSSLTNSYGLSLEASWELDLWNRLGMRERAALAELQATEADLAGVRLSVAGRAARGWVELTELERQRELAARTVEAFAATRQLAEDRYERGLISSVDVHLTRTNAENAAALLALRENQRQQASRRLEVLLGRYPSGALRGGESLPPPPVSVPAALPAELVLRRPDLLAAERRVVAAHARTGEARRNLLPRINLTGSTGTTSNDVADLLDGDFSVWSIAGSLLQPIFQGGRLRAQVDLNEAGADAAYARFAQTALGAFSEVESALAAEGLLARREAHLGEALEASTRAWQLAEDRYRRGVGDLLSVLEAQRRALNAEGELIAVRSARLLARIDLHLALGGGFDATAGPSTDFLAPDRGDDGTDTAAAGPDDSPVSE